jgi:hypothetical protein
MQAMQTEMTECVRELILGRDLFAAPGKGGSQEVFALIGKVDS